MRGGPLGRVMERAENGGQDKHYLDVRMRSAGHAPVQYGGGQSIRAGRNGRPERSRERKRVVGENLFYGAEPGRAEELDSADMSVSTGSIL